MLERSERLLKLLCAALALLLVAQWVRVVIRRAPLANVVIPAVPSLLAAANIPSEAKSARPQPDAGAAKIAPKGTNTNTLVHAGPPATNAPGLVSDPKATNAATTTPPFGPPPPTADPNPPGGGPPPVLAATAPGPFPRMPGPANTPALPPEVQARIDRITESEVLAPANRPPPMALLGIAGADVFLRTATGQTGLVKQGDDLGGVKILKIGVNRVLVEERGEKKELTIFEGLGGESLLPKPSDNPK